MHIVAWSSDGGDPRGVDGWGLLVLVERDNIVLTVGEVGGEHTGAPAIPRFLQILTGRLGPYDLGRHKHRGLLEGAYNSNVPAGTRFLHARDIGPRRPQHRLFGERQSSRANSGLLAVFPDRTLAGYTHGQGGPPVRLGVVTTAGNLATCSSPILGPLADLPLVGMVQISPN